ncbi:MULTISPECIES: alpha/beta hydrolase [unclassified Rhodococcus (in: high G+C Gram-positive bacteria)]|uniref:alpha/beta hydrolase n=1 Tax=unclassified Rhodococcus (in: high G+C Gram-positive bacteria) TaxID=192944 RepID=UPI00146D1C52|nr:alpha/beta hydrolase [Rhodococcus sp. BL-253-APC-6A1W]NMD97150.1 alpha/beta hydrolase [Rhodococcus sp. BL-253-APC-6A1W]
MCSAVTKAAVPNTAAIPSPDRPPLVREFAGVSLQSRALSMSVRRTVRPFIEAWAFTPSLPWPASLVDRAAFSVRPVQGTRRHQVRLPECRAEFLYTGNAGDQQAVLYLHGGAFLCCGLATHRNLVSRISSATQAPVLSVGYRMLPRHPIRRSVEDGIAGLRWLLSRGYPIDRIVVAGDSAGGFLTFAVAHEALRLGLGRVAGTVALSPLTDLDPFPKLDHPNSYRCALFPRRAVPVLLGLVRRAESRGGEGYAPVVSPVDLDLTGMPPALIQTGSEEMVYTDARLMGERLEAAGVPAEVQVWEKQIHVFQAAAGVVPEGTRALSEVGRFVRALG